MHNYAEWQKLDTKDYILHDSIYIKIQKMPSNLQKRQWLLPGDHIAGKNYKEHTQGNFQEQLMFTILIGMMVSRTDTHVKPIKLYTSYMSNLFNVSYISVKLFFLKSIKGVYSIINNHFISTLFLHFLCKRTEYVRYYNKGTT